MDLMKYFSWYLITINIVAFMMYGIDKEKAKRASGWKFWCVGRNENLSS